MAISFPVPSSTLIPHRPPIVFIDYVTGAESLSSSSSYTVPKGAPYVDAEGRLMPEAMVEVMAQCFAAGAGLYAKETGRMITWGYLAGIKDLKISEHVFSGDVLQASAIHSMCLGGLHVLDCRVTRGETIVASAQLKIFVPGE